VTLDPLTPLDHRLDIFARKGSWTATHDYLNCRCCGSVLIGDDEGLLASLPFTYKTAMEVEERASRMVAAQRLNELTEEERQNIVDWGLHDGRTTPIQYE
jgi:hypothetical protein